jgi:hypothetical protein
LIATIFWSVDIPAVKPVPVTPDGGCVGLFQAAIKAS